LLRIVPRKNKGLPGYWAVLFDRAAFDCPADSPVGSPYRLRRLLLSGPQSP
jgi:hypothetical protein